MNLNTTLVFVFLKNQDLIKWSFWVRKIGIVEVSLTRLSTLIPSAFDFTSISIDKLTLSTQNWINLNCPLTYSCAQKNSGSYAFTGSYESDEFLYFFRNRKIVPGPQIWQCYEKTWGHYLKLFELLTILSESLHPRSSKCWFPIARAEENIILLKYLISNFGLSV